MKLAEQLPPPPPLRKFDISNFVTHDSSDKKNKRCSKSEII